MLLKSFFYQPIKHVLRLWSDSEYLTWCLLDAKLARTKRYTAKILKVHDLTISFPDAASFLSTYNEIYVNRIYHFNFPTDGPRILDLGANIGLSVLYFKKKFPGAQITAFEADPLIFDYLKRNVHGNGFDDVRLINKAVWNEATVLQFQSEGADGGRVAEVGEAKVIEVEAVDITNILQQQKFDFLKIDIEGAEEKVFPACRGFLSGIKYIFLEYHSNSSRKQNIGEILSLMEEEGFRIDIHNVRASRKPFLTPNASSVFDLQLNIFAWRV
jgi:FkbM family methyltransferase